LFIFLFGINLIIAQEKAEGELIIHIDNNVGNANIKIEVALVSPLCWDASNDPNYPDLHNLTTQYPGSYQTTTSEITLDWEGCWSYPYYQHAFGLGNYKVTAYQEIYGEFETIDYFYIDYRTSDLPENFGSGDLHVDFNVGVGIFYYHSTQNYFPTSTTIWEQKPWIDSITTELEPLPPDDFELSASGGHPYLTWNHSSNTGDYWTGYKIYRDICAGGNPYFTENNLIATVGKYTTSYTDQSYSTGHGWEGYYCIKSINGSRASDFTEVLEIGIDAFHKTNESNHREFEYQLNQNFPNPFNPTTDITFSLKDNSLVTLKVFDILGREVDVLINCYLDSGNYSVKFDGSSFESGIYFYEIWTKNFRDVKKLILLK